MGRIQTTIAVLGVLAGSLTASAQGPARRVYVLHSGVHIFFSHPEKNHAAFVLRDELRWREVPERDIVVLDCPYPQATWNKPVPRDGVVMFLDSIAPASKVSHDTYRRLDQALRAQNVGPHDEIIWIGHSAGGQMGLTMAQLAKNPTAVKDARPYRFHTIVTLGTPVGCNEVPDGVRVLHYFSPQDKIVRITCDLGPWLLPQMGYSWKFRPCTPAPGKNCLTRLWHGVEHPDWLYERPILDRVWQDVNDQATPWHREPRAALGPGAGLSQLLGQMLHDEHRICVEDF